MGADGVATFQTTTQLVVETVRVKDKSGKPIEGLTAKDFTVTEDGAPQAIKFFEYQKLPEDPRLPSCRPERTPPRRSWPAPWPSFPGRRSHPSVPGNIHYRDHRLLALYFDMTAMPLRISCARWTRRRSSSARR